MVHQSAWQQKMLAMYGSELTLIDATYNTTSYELPLLCICIPTNVGYFYAACVLVSNETTETLTAALQNIKLLNPEWRPKNFVTDFSESQIAALEAVFPGMFYAVNCLVSIMAALNDNLKTFMHASAVGRVRNCYTSNG